MRPAREVRIFRDILWIVAAVLVLAVASPAEASHRGNAAAVAPATCPFAMDNGCSGANLNSNFQVSAATFAATAIGDGGTNILNTYTPNKNRAGIEYPVSYDKTLVLKDPTTATLPSGCSYNPAGVLVTSGPTGPVVTCNISVDTTLDGFDFSGDSSPSVNNCIPIRVLGNTGNLIITNTYFRYTIGSFCDGGWIKKDSNGGVIAKWDEFDGQSSEASPNGAIPISSNGSGTADASDMTYCYLINLGTRALNASRGFGHHLVYYNYIGGAWGSATTGGGTHGEVGLFGGGSPANTVKFQAQEFVGNTIVFPVSAAGHDVTTNFYCQTGSTAQFATSCLVSANTVIANKDSGGGNPYGAVLFEEQWSGVDVVTITYNDIYPNGANLCSLMGAPTNSATAQPTGNIINVTSVNASWIAGFKINHSGFSEATILPYGTSGTTGTGGVGTYAFDGPPQTLGSSGSWHVTPPIGVFTASNNLSLVNGTSEDPTYPQGNSTCTK